MPSSRYHRDSNKLQQYKLLVLVLLVCAALASLLLYHAITPYFLAVIGLMGLLAVTSLFSRVNWGDQVQVLDNAITVLKCDHVKYHISYDELVWVVIADGSLVLIWQDDTMRRTLSLGRESFLAPTYAALSKAIQERLPQSKVDIRTRSEQKKTQQEPGF